MAEPPPPAPVRAPEPGPTHRRELLVSLAAYPPHERDRACESLLGFGPPAAHPRVTAHADATVDVAVFAAFEGNPWTRSRRAPADSLAEENVGHHASGVAPLMRAVLDVPIRADDVVVDLGSGLGKAAFILHLASGARAHGVELERALATRATESAVQLGLDGVSFEHGDARSADLHEGTVFYLYLPFTGSTLDAVMERLHGIAARHAIVVITLGLDLRPYPWLTARATDAFWLAIYDSTCEGAEPRRGSSRAELEAWAEASEGNRVARALAYET